MTCKHCGQKLVSELKIGTYAALILFMQLVLTIVGVAFVFAVVAKAWFAAAAIGLIFLLCVTPPFMIMHARNRISEITKR